MKTWVLTGIAPVISAFFALVKAEKAAGIDLGGEEQSTRSVTSPLQVASLSEIVSGLD